MPNDDLNVALIILRVVRGWNQDDLARASGVRNTAVSDYERGRKTPELKTLERLVAAMGYPLSAVDRARSFIVSLRAESQILGSAPQRAGKASSPVDKAAALQWEAEQVSAEMGRAVSRMARVMFALAGRAQGDLPNVDALSERSGTSS